jgi:hypothetical protein
MITIARRLAERGSKRRIDSNKFAFRAGRRPSIGGAAARLAMGRGLPATARAEVFLAGSRRRPPLDLGRARAALRMAAGDGLDPAGLARLLEVPTEAVEAAWAWVDPTLRG